MSDNVLIVGGSGFIGSNIYKNLQLNTKIYSLTRNSENTKDGSIYLEDFSCVDSLTSIIKDYEIDQILYCIGFAHYKNESDVDPNYHISLLKIFIEISKDTCIKKFFFFSSVNVYGSSYGKSLCEDDFCQPSDITGIFKLKCENLLLEEFNNFPISIIILRLPIVYGKGSKGFVGKIFNILNKNLPLIWFSSVNYKSFISIHNLVDFIKLAINHDKEIVGIYNLSDNQDVTLDFFLKLYSKFSNSTSLLFFVNEKYVNFIFKIFNREELFNKLSLGYVLNTNKVKSDFSWYPRYKVGESVSLLFNDS